MNFVWDVILKISGFVKSVASEDDGSGSASRVVALMIGAGCIAALLLSVHYQHNLPTGDQLTGLSHILACAVGGYVANQLRHKNDPPSTPDNPDAS